MHRPTIGLIAVVLLAVGLYTRQQPDGSVSGACLRMAAVMAIWWFAHPQMHNLPRWLIGVVLVGFLVVLRWPKLLLFALPIIATLWLLRPRAPGSRSKLDQRRG
jgi:hypothetical protein